MVMRDGKPVVWLFLYMRYLLQEQRKHIYSRVLRRPTLGIRLVLSNGLCGSVRCSLRRADPSSVPSQHSELLSGDPPAVNEAFEECKHYRERRRRRLRAAASSGIRFFPWGCDAWECNAKQLSIPLFCTGRSASAAHPPAFFLHFFTFQVSFVRIQADGEPGCCRCNQPEENKLFLNHRCTANSSRRFHFQHLKKKKKSTWSPVGNLFSDRTWACDSVTAKNQNASALTQHLALHGPGW